MAANDQNAQPQPQPRRDGLTSAPTKLDQRADSAGNAIDDSNLTPSDSGARERNERIAKAAYSRAEKRGFAPGAEWDDWLDAEREVDGEIEQLTTRSRLPDA